MFSVFKYDGESYERVFDDNEKIHAEIFAANHSKYDESSVYSIYDTSNAPVFVCYYEHGEKFTEDDDTSMQE